ncbi:MAG: septum formation initiator family protein [Bdellovibrionota bacterium]
MVALKKVSKRTWFYLFIFIAWALSISGVFGNSGLVQAYKLSRVKYDIVLRINALENEKARLATGLRDLESDSFVQEQAVRESLGFVRENELVFEFR